VPSVAAKISSAPASTEVPSVDSTSTEVSEDAVEIIRERRSDGTIKIIRHMIQDAEGNYIKHGPWQELDEQGDVVAEGKYDDNKRHGMWRRTIDGAEATLFAEEPYTSFQGPFVSEATLNHGKLHGHWTIYDSTNKRISVIEFADGKRHGTAVWMYPNGQTRNSSTYVEGVIDGELNRYDPDGNVSGTENYESGRKVEIQVDYFENKQKRLEGKNLLPKLAIATPDDWWNPTLATFETVGEAMQDGTWNVWHQNGQKNEQGAYDHGKPVGKFVSWHSNGQKASEGSYVDGNQHERWIWWHSNGQKQADGHYTNGRRSGDWAWWNADGRLEEKRSLVLLKQPAERTSRRPSTSQ
jgi:antitoxin component YwqK of YwqJK toxin-antitoxin module